MSILDVLKTPVTKESEKGFWRVTDDANFSLFYPVGPTRPPSSEGFTDVYKSQRTIRRLVASAERRKTKKGKE